MASILKKTNDKYAVRWRDLSGKQRWRSCPDHRTAKQLAREIEQQLALGHDWSPDVPPRVVRLDDVLKAYLLDAKNRLAPRTMRRYVEYLTLLQRFLQERDGHADHEPSVLSRKLLTEFFGWLRRPENGLHGNQRSLDTTRKIVEGVQLAWAWADNVEQWPEVPPAKRIEMKREAAGPVHAPTWEEMDRCISALSGWSKRVAIVLRYTGLRIGEVMQLKWSDLDLDHATLTLRKEIDKSRRGRTIPISQLLVDRLRTWDRDDDYLIRTGSKIILRHRQPRAKDFRRAWRKAGVPPHVWEGRPSHAFRKGFKSCLLRDGAAPDAVDHLQGHVLGGARSRYIDPDALRLDETVAMVPRVLKWPPPIPPGSTKRSSPVRRSPPPPPGKRRS